MRLRELLGGLVLVLASAKHAAAQDVFEFPVDDHPQRIEALRQLSRELATQGRTQGEFVQRKFLEILQQPLQSHGSFVFSDGVIIWQVKEPFAITYRYTHGDLFKQDENEAVLVRPSDDPMLYGFFAFFSSLFDMSQDELEKLFRIYFTAREDGWVVGLEPKSGFLRETISSIVVEGRRLPASTQSEGALVIEQVAIREPDGDSSQLLFSY